MSCLEALNVSHIPQPFFAPAVAGCLEEVPGDAVLVDRDGLEALGCDQAEGVEGLPGGLAAAGVGMGQEEMAAYNHTMIITSGVQVELGGGVLEHPGGAVEHVVLVANAEKRQVQGVAGRHSDGGGNSDIG